MPGTILVEAERGEDRSLQVYRAALSKTLTPPMAAIIERQFAEIETAHQRIRALRDATAPPGDSSTPGPSQPLPEDVPKGV